MRLVSFTPKPAEFDSASGLTFINSDLAFSGNYVYQGNFSGFIDLGREEPGEAGQASLWFRASRRRATRRSIGNLLFISAEGNGNRNDCAKGGVKDPADHSRTWPACASTTSRIRPRRS